MRDLNAVRVEVDSIEERGFGVYRLEGPSYPDTLIGWMTFDKDADPVEVQYVTSVVAAALNDPTNYARAIRNKARNEARSFLGEDRYNEYHQYPRG